MAASVRLLDRNLTRDDKADIRS